jgi:hypothetical protein
METNVHKCRLLLKRFQERWPIDSLGKMQLSQYVGLKNPDTFCQWIETKTRDLGSIKGHFSNKFGIYKRRDAEENPQHLISDDEYSWVPFYGDNRKQAFKSIRHEVRHIAQSAQLGQFNYVDSQKINHLTRWKIAFLYSNERIVPIFKKELLWGIAKDLGMPDAVEKPFSQIYQFIYSKKPAGLDIFSFASALLLKYGKDKPVEPNYYIIGSKYGEGNDQDIFPAMLSFNAVSTGFAWDCKVDDLYGSNQSEIVNALNAKNELPKSYNTLKLFLQFKPGDIIAIKSTGSPKGKAGFLEIIAYAVVVERDGKVYWFENTVLGHCINVEFIATDIKNQYNLGGYGRTVHKIADPAVIDNIFGSFLRPNTIIKAIKKRRRRKAAKSKSIAGQERKGSKGYVTNPKHNLIQVLFRDMLIEQYGDKVMLEENFVDVKLVLDDSITFYEVKPYVLAEDCIQEALGQLFAYSFYDETPSMKKILRVVGPSAALRDEKKWIAYLKDSFSLDFDYIHFDLSNY